MTNSLSEDKIIKLFNRIMPKNMLLSDDDVSGIEFNNSKIFISSDMLVESTDIPPTMNLVQASRKSIIMSVSDFASKGIIPKYCILSVGIPKSYSEKNIKNLVKGIAKGLKEYNIQLIGGDTNSSSELIIDCTIIGFSDVRIPKRKSARNNDVVYCLGTFGLTGSGLFLLINKIEPSNSFEKKAIQSVLNPSVDLDIFVKLVNRQLINSSIDSSDGLCLSLYKLAESSSVSIYIDKLPFSNGLKKFSSKYDKCINDLLLYSGEEYNIVFTVKPSNVDKLEQILNKYNINFNKFGTVQKGSASVYYKNKLLKKRGWDSFIQ